MLPILLCIFGWGWSVGHSAGVCYSHADKSGICSTGWGVIVVYVGKPPGITSDGWDCKAARIPETRLLLPNGLNTFLGFGYHSAIDYHDFEVPYWFLIIVFSFALLFAWRKTRPKSHPATAFPVEINAPSKIPN
jgi:hypothetical protein